MTDRSPTRKFAQELEIPFADFEKATLEETVDYLRSISRIGLNLDTKAQPYRLNFIILDPNKKSKPIGLLMKNVKLDTLCERIAQISGVSVSFNTDAIVFSAREWLKFFLWSLL